MKCLISMDPTAEEQIEGEGGKREREKIENYFSVNTSVN